MLVEDDLGKAGDFFRVHARRDVSLWNGFAGWTPGHDRRHLAVADGPQDVRRERDAVAQRHRTMSGVRDSPRAACRSRETL
jgi:hypothetical protein